MIWSLKLKQSLKTRNPIWNLPGTTKDCKRFNKSSAIFKLLSFAATNKLVNS